MQPSAVQEDGREQRQRRRDPAAAEQRCRAGKPGGNQSRLADDTSGGGVTGKRQPKFDDEGQRDDGARDRRDRGCARSPAAAWRALGVG